MAPAFTTAGEQNVRIVAKGDTTTYMDADPHEIRQVVTALTPPTFEAVRNGNSVTVTVTSSASGVRGFVVNIGGVDQPMIVGGTSGSYQIAGAAGTVAIKVRAIADGFGDDGVYYIDSAYSGVVSK